MLLAGAPNLPSNSTIHEEMMHSPRIIIHICLAVLLAQPSLTAELGTSIAVDTLDRKAVVNFFNSVYLASEGVDVGWTGDVENCVPGNTSQAFKDASLLRINYYRAMAALPADIRFDEDLNSKCQQAALMMSAKGELSHYPGLNWPCSSIEGAFAASASNLALVEGIEAFDAWMDDYGTNNFSVGHRNAILGVRKTIMGIGAITGIRGSTVMWHAFGNMGFKIGDMATHASVPSREGEQLSKVSVEWVAWPPQGYVPYQVMPSHSERWSFAYNDTEFSADFAAASVIMRHDGTNVPVSVEYQASNPIVWKPQGLRSSRPESDITYSIIVSNVVVQGKSRLFSYDVTIIDPNSVAEPYTFVTLAGLAGNKGNEDGFGSTARFNSPQGVAVGSEGSVYVADRDNSRIRKITPAGSVSTINVSRPDIRGVFHPTGLAIDAEQNIYVADWSDQMIRKITAGGVFGILAGAGKVGSEDGAGSNARFNYPTSVAVDKMGNVFVADSLNCTIRTITRDGVVSTLAGSVAMGGRVNGSGGSARFSGPAGVATDRRGDVYVADTGSSTIRKVTPNGMVTTIAGSGLPGDIDGKGSVARFNNPTGLALDDVGNIFVADTDNHTIRRITPNGFVTTIAGLGQSNGASDGTGISVRFAKPAGVAVDAQGNVYVADTGNHTIRKGYLSNLSNRIRLNIQSKDNRIILSWTEPGMTLEEADSVAGPWRLAGNESGSQWTLADRKSVV